jgi:hypothetical protein
LEIKKASLKLAFYDAKTGYFWFALKAAIRA